MSSNQSNLPEARGPIRARNFSPSLSAIPALIRVGLENRVPDNFRWIRIHVASGRPDSTPFSAHRLSRPNGCRAGTLRPGTE
jgi:hypothetical protein